MTPNDMYDDIPSSMRAYVRLAMPLRVIPIKPRSKEPCIKEWQNQGIPDEATIRCWTNEFPNINVGALLGNGLAAIDIDGPFGEQMLQSLSAGNVPDTWEMLTPGDGRRLFFQNIPGLKLMSKTFADPNKKHSECSLMGDGKQTLLPPSVHPNGKLYEWVPGKSPWDILPAHIPAWMLTIMTAQNAQPSPKASGPAGGKGRDVLDVLERNCRRFASDWQVQQGAGLPEEDWFRWSSHLVKTGNTDAAEVFSKTSHKHNQRSEDRLEQLKDPSDRGKSGLCMAFGCSQEEIEVCQGKLKMDEDGKIKNRPVHHLKLAKQKRFLEAAEEAVKRVESGDHGAHLEPEALKAFAELLNTDKAAYARLEYRLRSVKVPVREFKKDVQDTLKQLRRTYKPANSALNAAGFDVNETGEPKGLNLVKFAKYVIAQHHLGTAQGNRVHTFEDGYWQELSTDDLKRMLMEIFESLAPNFWCTDFETEYLQALYRLAEPLNRLNERRDLVNLRNGMLSLEDFLLHSHDPKYQSTIRINVELDTSAECPEFMKFLDSVFQGDKELINLTQEMFGYSLTSETIAQKCFMLYGKGANGKSVLLDVLRELCGPENTSTVSLEDLKKDFARHQLVGKTLNLSTENEVDKRGLNTQYLKAIVTGDPITVERKYSDPFTYKPICKMVFALNKLPYSQDKTDGFFRRLIILPFLARFKGKQADKRLAEKLLRELPGILNFALEGLKRLRQREYEFTLPKAAAELLEEYRRHVNPLESFFEEHIVTTPSPGRALRNNIYGQFQEWCHENGHKGLQEMSIKRFWKEFRDMLVEKEIPFEEKRSDGRDYFYGITIEVRKAPSIRRGDASVRHSVTPDPTNEVQESLKDASEKQADSPSSEDEGSGSPDGRVVRRKPSELSKIFADEDGDDGDDKDQDDGPAAASVPTP